MELTKLPSLISEVQHHIDNINQKELFASDETTKLLVNEAMEDITFNFSKISEEELRIVGGKDAVTEKYKKTVRAFTQNIDPDDPEFITLQEAFCFALSNTVLNLRVYLRLRSKERNWKIF